MRTLVLLMVITFVLGPADVWASQKSVATDVEARALKQMAAAIPLGSRIKAQTQTGRRLDGTLMNVTDEAVIIKKKTRLPEPAVTVPFADLASLELRMDEGTSFAKILGGGLAAGAGAILTIFAFASMLDD